MFVFFLEFKVLEGLIVYNEDLFKCGICLKVLWVVGINCIIYGKVFYFKIGSCNVFFIVVVILRI